MQDSVDAAADAVTETVRLNNEGNSDISDNAAELTDDLKTESETISSNLTQGFYNASTSAGNMASDAVGALNSIGRAA
jgi:hypothetical protein